MSIPFAHCVREWDAHVLKYIQGPLSREEMFRYDTKSEKDEDDSDVVALRDGNCIQRIVR